MSVETIAVILSAAGLLLGFVGMIGWQIVRTDTQFRRLDDTLTARISSVEGNLSARIDSVEAKLTERIDKVATNLDGVERELVEVKIGLARLEGPPRRLLPVH